MFYVVETNSNLTLGQQIDTAYGYHNLEKAKAFAEDLKIRNAKNYSIIGVSGVWTTQTFAEIMEERRNARRKTAAA